MSDSPCLDACKAFNKHRPELVAAALPEMIELLQAVSDYRHISAKDFNAKYPKYTKADGTGITSALIWSDMAIDARRILEKALPEFPF